MPCENLDPCCQTRPVQTPGGIDDGSTSTSGIAGPRGAQGIQGDDGDDGEDGNRTIAFVGSPGFLMPAENAEVTIPIDTTIEQTGLYWMENGLVIFIDGAGYFLVGSVGASSVTATNLGYSVNATPGTSIDALAAVSPSAPRGSDASPLSLLYLQLQQQENTGDDGGTFTSGAYRPRLLNTTTSDIGSLLIDLDETTGVFTLKGGYTYEFEAGAPAFDVRSHRVRVRNIDTSAVVAQGTSEFSTSGGGQTESVVFGRVTIATDTQFLLEHRCETTQANNGMGRACGFADDAVNYELYAWIKLWATPSL